MKATRSGWCGLGIPVNHVVHGRCHLEGCPCYCHHKTPAAGDAPGVVSSPSGEHRTPAAGPTRHGVFSAKAVPGAVMLVIDPLTASILAGLLEVAYSTAELPTSDRPLWMWDVAELRREAANADQAGAKRSRVDVHFDPVTPLHLVVGGETS